MQNHPFGRACALPPSRRAESAIQGVSLVEMIAHSPAQNKQRFWGVEASRAGVQGVHYGRDGARPSRCGRDRLGGTPRPTLRPRRSAALTVWPQGQWHPCLSQWHVRKPSGTTKAPRQWFSNDLPLVCALAVLPCAPCRAPTVSKCSAQGKTLRKDARGTGMAEERIERSTCLSQAFGAPRGLCEALSQ